MSWFKFKSKKRKRGILLKKQRREIDYPLLLSVLLLSLFGLLMIFEASAILAYQVFGDKYYFFKEQAMWLGVGVALLWALSLFDYHFLYPLAVPFLFSTIIFLGVVFIPGIGVKALGASRWLNLKFFSFQPAELAKLTLAIYLSAWFAGQEKGRLLAFLFLIFIILGLVVAEPDLGTAIVIGGEAIILYFLSGTPIFHFLFLLPLTFLSFFGLSIASPYRLKRLLTFFNPHTDPFGTSYHIRQVLIALGSGGVFGLGFGKSRQKYLFLPEVTTDSIFAIIGEEFGFLGTLVIILVFLFIIYRGFLIARRAPDRFGQLLAMGIISYLAVQTIINLAAMAALLPLTGVPLPFLSYGGSSLVVTLSGIGILLNISYQGGVR